MFNKVKQKLKSPISVIRKPEEINKEYTEAISRLGLYSVDLEAIARAEAKQEKRKIEIAEASAILFDRIDEMSVEMDEAQKEIKRKKDQAEMQTAKEQMGVAQ